MTAWFVPGRGLLARCRVWLAGAAWAMLAPAAHGQVLDSFFAQQAGPAAGGIPADDSQVRAASEYTPLGVRASGFTILPQLTESAGYDSDVSGLAAGGSLFIDTNASLVARSDWARDSLSAQLTVDDRRYPSVSSQNNTSFTASLGGTYDIGRDQLGVGFSHLSLVETADQIGSVTGQPVPYQVDIGSVSYTFATDSPFSFVPSASIDRYTFDAVPIPGSDTTQSFRDRVVLRQDLLTRYELAPGVDTLLSLNGTEISYDHSIPGLPSLDSNGGSVLAGVGYTASGLFRYRALIGYQVRAYASPLYGTLSAPIAEASVTWTPTRLTTLILTLRRDIEDSASEGISAFTYTAGQLDLTHELRRNVKLSADAEIQRAESQSAALTGKAAAPFVTGSSSQTIYGVGAKAEWMLNRSISLIASTHFTTRHSAGTGSFSEEISLLAVHFAL